MRERIIYVLAIVLGFHFAFSQEVMEEESKPAPPRVTFGIGLFGNSGFALMNYGNLQKDWDTPTGLNQDSIKFFMRGLNSTHSVNIELLFAKRVMLRGGLAFLRSDASETAKGQVKIRSNLIGGSLGFAVINKNRWLGYPFIGFYSNSQKMLAKNYAPEPIYFGDVMIDRNELKEFKTSLNLLEVGIGTKYVIPKANNAIVGAEIGGYFSIGEGSWQTSDGNNVNNVSGATMKGAYLRVSLGLGYYKYGETTPKSDVEEDIEVEKEKKSKKKKEKDIEDTEAKPEKKKEKKSKKKKDRDAKDTEAKHEKKKEKKSKKEKTKKKKEKEEDEDIFE